MPVWMAAIGRRRRKRLARPPRIIYPTLLERAYQRDIVRMLEPARSLVRARVLPALEPILLAAAQRADELRADDDYSDRIAHIFNGVTVEYGALVPESAIRGRASDAAVDVNRHNRRQVAREVRTVLGVDVLQTEAWLEPAVKAFTRENVALIRSIPQRYFSEIERLVTDGARSGRRAEDIERDIEARYKVSRSRAKLIARDQVGKWHGELTQTRHKALGLGRYRWRTSMDERVRGRPDGSYPDARPSHWDREGKIFSYDNPPPGGPPGFAIQCRCFDEPVFEDLLGDEYAVIK